MGHSGNHGCSYKSINKQTYKQNRYLRTEPNHCNIYGNDRMADILHWICLDNESLMNDNDETKWNIYDRERHNEKVQLQICLHQNKI